MEPRQPKEFEEKVLQIDRVSRTVAGGRRMRFRALLLVGDRKGRFGIGVAKASDTQSAVQKATRQAKKNMIKVELKNGTISREIRATYGNALVILKPAKKGKFIVAGGVVRAIAEAAGIENLSSKMLGSANKINNARATILALQKLSKGQNVRTIQL